MNTSALRFAEALMEEGHDISFATSSEFAPTLGRTGIGQVSVGRPSIGGHRASDSFAEQSAPPLVQFRGLLCGRGVDVADR